MQIHSKLTGVKGIVRLYNEALRFRDMITREAEERARILTFWNTHGDAATKEAFTVSRATLFRWQKLLTHGGGKLEALNPGSTAPKERRRRIIPEAVKQLIIEERKHERLGKEKLARLLKDDGIACYSSSTVGRMIGDLKKRGLLADPRVYSFYGKTGAFIEKKPRKPRKKLRSAGWHGGLVKADTIVRFQDGLKRYIVTALDLESEFAFAYAYPSHTSKAAADFMTFFKSVAPLTLEAVQTDNGGEFALHFAAHLDREGILHFHAYPRSPKMQAEIERFNRTLSEAFIASRRHLLAYDLPAFNRALMDWLLCYNTRRPHWSIGLISPLRYILNKLPAKESQMCWTSPLTGQLLSICVLYLYWQLFKNNR
jgi:transposase InsO family protein